MSKHKTYLIAILLLLAYCSSIWSIEGVDILKIKPGNTQVVDFEGENSFYYFKWIIPHQFNYQNSTISITIRYSSPVQNPTKIYLTTNSELPSPENTLIECEEYCLIKLRNLMEPKKKNVYNQLVVGITNPESDIQLELSLDVIEITPLKNPTEITEISFYNAVTPLLFRIATPNDIEFDKVIFQLSPQNPVVLTYSYQIFFFNQELMRTQVTSVDGWDNTKLLVINDGEVNFCRNCIYYIGLLGSSQDKFNFKVTFEMDTQIQLKLNQLTHLVLTPQREYELVLQLNKTSQKQLKNNDKTLGFEFMVYSGQLIAGVNPDTRPNQTQQYEWERVIITRSVISLRKEKRVESEANDKIYYLRIQSVTESATTFSILPFYEEPDYNQILEFSVTELDSVSRDEVLIYKLMIVQVEANFVFYVTLESEEQGEAGLVVKRCKRGEQIECKIDMNDYIYSNDVNTQSDVLYSSKNQQNQQNRLIQADITHDAQICNKQCFYAIGVIGIAEYTLTSIQVKPDIVPIDLSDWDSNYGLLSKGEQGEYLYKISTWRDKSQVIVHFIAFSGSAEVDITTNDPQINEYNKDFGNKNHKETIAYFDIPLAIYSYDNKVIRVKVNAKDESCFFQIKVTNEGRSFIQDVHSLFQGYTTVHRLLPTQNEVFFGFTLDLSYDFSGICAITISPNDPNLQYELVVGKSNESPNEPNNVFKKITNPQTSLYLNSLHKDFFTFGDYYIKFKVNRTVEQLDQNIKFWIRYDIITDIQDIRFGYPLVEYIGPTKTEIYKFPYTEKLSDIIQLSVAAWNDELDVIYEVWNGLETNTVSTHEESLFNNALSNIDIVSSNIDVVPSNIYVYIHNKRRYHVNYTVTLTEDDTSIILQDGIPTPATLSPQTIDRNFTYEIQDNKQQIIIGLQAWETPINLRVQLCKNSVKCVLYRPQNYTLVSPSLQTIEIQPSSLKDCDVKQCTLKIRTQVFDNNFDYGTHSSTHILQVTQTLSILLEGTQMLGYLIPGEIQYYRFHIPSRPLTAKIILTTLGDGKAFMLLLRNQNVNEIQFPDLDENNYTSSAQITLTATSDYGTTEQIAGLYSIGVKGFNNCTFLITYYYSDTTKIRIVQGLPFELYLTQTPITLLYFHYRNTGFDVLALKEGGQVNLVVQQNDKFIEENDDIIHVQKNESIYCTWCTYRIKLSEQPQQPSQKVTLYVNVEKEPAFLQVGKPIVDTVTPRSYNQYAFPFAQFEDITITLIIYYGEPSLLIMSDFGPTIDEKGDGILQQVGPKDIINGNILRVIITAEQLQNIINDKQLKGIYIKVTTKDTECRYSLIAHGAESQVTLRDGYIYYGSLISDDTQTFSFAASPFSEDFFDWKTQKVSLTLEIHNFVLGTPLPEFFAGFQSDWGFDFAALSLFGESSQFSEVQYSQKYLDEHNGKIHLELEVLSSGVFHVNFTNKAKTKIDYTVGMQAHQLTEAALNTNYYAFLREGNTNLYHIYVDQKGYLLITIIDCYGSISVHASSTYSNLINQKYDVKVSLYENVMETQVKIKLKKAQDIYFKIGFVDGVQTKEGLRFREPKEAYYSLNLIVLDNNPNLDQYHQGGGSQISWSRVEPGAFEFHFKQIIRNDGINATTVIDNKTENMDVNYKIYIAKDEIYLDLVSRCGGIMSTSYSLVSGEFSDVDRFSKMFNVTCDKELNPNNGLCGYMIRLYDSKTPHRSESYFATIIGEVKDKLTGQVYRLPYDIIEFKTQVIYRTPKDVYYLGLGTVFLVALCYMCAIGFNKCLRSKITGNDIEMLGLTEHEERNNTATVEDYKTKKANNKNEVFSEMMEY